MKSKTVPLEMGHMALQRICHAFHAGICFKELLIKGKIA